VGPVRPLRLARGRTRRFRPRGSDADGAKVT
jgi:hypothetical protein